MSNIIRTVKYLAVFIVIVFTGWWTLIEFPSVFFKYKFQNNNLVIHSDQPIPSNIKNITDEVMVRLRSSDIFDETIIYNVHISNEKWRWMLVANIRYMVGGFSVGFNGNVFIRPSVIVENRITSPYPPREISDADQRDLTYFITHEIGHILMYDEIGYVKHWIFYPKWLQEGYPDYIAKASSDFEDNLKQFKNNELRLTVESGLYVRYHLYVAYLMDVKGLSIQEIINNVPNESEIQQTLLDMH